jgi:hypothetical protein
MSSSSSSRLDSPTPSSMSESLGQRPGTRRFVAPIVGCLTVVLAVWSTFVLFGPVFRSANCYPAIVGVVGQTVLGLSLAVLCGAVATLYGRAARRRWVLAVVLAALAVLSAGPIALLGNPGLEISEELLAACGRTRAEVYFHLIWLDLPVFLALAGIGAAKVFRHPALAWIAFVVVSAATLIAFRVWFWVL